MVYENYGGTLQVVKNMIYLSLDDYLLFFPVFFVRFVFFDFWFPASLLFCFSSLLSAVPCFSAYLLLCFSLLSFVSHTVNKP